MSKKELYRIDLDYSCTWDRTEAWFFRRGMKVKYFVLDPRRYARLARIFRERALPPRGYTGEYRFGVIYQE